MRNQYRYEQIEGGHMKKRQRIYSPSGKLNDSDRQTICTYLVKAGYTVRIGKEKPEGKKSPVYFIEYWEEEDA